ncbi:MAG: rhomboid family intramembrane serine protease [Candidatus Nanohaloarchaea archaeon]|nr:rhomboid family intramembrane serine protease [Candidatus Nanohaloarchaea archaeon]
MGECSECGDSVSMPFTCKFCGESFCSQHRLPENHNCGGLEEYRADKKRTSDEITYDAEREEQEGRERNASPSAPGMTFVENLRVMYNRLRRKVKNFFSEGRGGSTGYRMQSPMTGAMKQSFPEIGTFTLLSMIFVGYLLQSSFEGLTRQFALIPTAVLQGELWRIVTTIFLHGSSFHLLVNAMVLFFFGSELERRVGTRKFLEIFFVAGIVASIGFTGFMQVTGCSINPCMAVGASGALYGVFATLAIIAPEITVLAFFVIPLRIRTALVLFAGFDLFLLTQNTLIASAAHLSGLVVGLYYGFKLQDRFRRQSKDVFYDMMGA